jgi:hypothetical protein
MRENLAPVPRAKIKKKPRGRPFQKKHRIGEATRFKPGQSGNPDGRPHSKEISKALRARLTDKVVGDKYGRTYAEALSDAWISLGLSGNVAALASLSDRAEGKPGIMGPGTPNAFVAYIQQLNNFSARLGAPEGHPNAGKLLPAPTDSENEESNDD